MTIGVLFWILMLLWLLFGLYTSWSASPGRPGYVLIGGHLLTFILFFLIGWRIFGPPVHG